MHEVGAVAVKSAVYALPNSPGAQEDFAWVKTEITALGGLATMFAADTVDTWTDDDLKQAFRQARQSDYEDIGREAAKTLKGIAEDAILRGPRRYRLERIARSLRERLLRNQAVDFFGATGREPATAVVASLEQRLAADRGPAGAPTTSPTDTLDPHEFLGRQWITRPRPGIDRISSAWLIRKYIDADATFAFDATLLKSKLHSRTKSRPKPAPTTRNLTFDTFNGDFTHDGESCTYEMLTQRFGITDPVALRLGQIVHDLDLREHQFNAPEAAAVGPWIEGLRRVHGDDHALLEQGVALFEALYQGLAAATATPPADRSPRRPRRRRKS